MSDHRRTYLCIKDLDIQYRKLDIERLQEQFLRSYFPGPRGMEQWMYLNWLEIRGGKKIAAQRKTNQDCHD